MSCFRTSCRLVVKGLGVVGSSGAQRNPDLLKARLSSVLCLIGSPTPFTVVNVIVYLTRGSPVYDVELESAASVNSLLREFSKFTRRKDAVRRPAELDRVSIYHSVTPGTRVRVSLMRANGFNLEIFDFCFNMTIYIHSTCLGFVTGCSNYFSF